MHKLVAQKQFITWGYLAHKLLVVCSITHTLYAALQTQTGAMVAKSSTLPVFIPSLYIAFSTAFFGLFIPVGLDFMPTIHRTYNNDNKNILNFLTIN
jgi:hypothetical protein